jgi:hypothetical protein
LGERRGKAKKVNKKGRNPKQTNTHTHKLKHQSQRNKMER